MAKLTMEEIREALDQDFLKHPVCPENTLNRDFLVATLNFVEKIEDDKKHVAEIVQKCVETIAEASAACYINVAYRLYGVNKEEPKAAVKIAEYIEQTMQRVWYEKLKVFAAIAIAEDMTKNDKGTT